MVIINLMHDAINLTKLMFRSAVSITFQSVFYIKIYQNNIFFIF